MEYYEETRSPFAPRGITKYVRIIIIANVVVFAIQLMARIFDLERLFTAIFSVNQLSLTHLFLWQPVTYMFMHDTGSIFHILFNMLGLYFFGCEIEDVLGRKRFLILYFATGILAGIGWLTIGLLGGTLRGFCVGASGAVLGTLGTFAAMFPERKVTFLLFFIIPITVTARTLAVGIIIFSSYAILFVSGRSIADSAHLFGCAAGYIYGLRIYSNPGMLDSHLYKQNKKNFFSRWTSNIRAKIRRSNIRVIEDKETQPTQEEIDAILDKIHSNGMNSLSVRERQLLRKASEKK